MLTEYYLDIIFDNINLIKLVSLHSGLVIATGSIDPTPTFWDDSKGIYEDAGRYRRLIGKLIYLTVTRPNISYAIGLLSQFIHKPREVHWQCALHVLAYIKNTPGRGLIYEKHSHLDVEAYSGYTGDMGDRNLHQDTVLT